MPRPLKKDNNAKQNNMLIRCMPRLTKPEYLLFYSLISMVIFSDNEDTVYKVITSEFIKVMKVDPDHTYHEIKKTVQSLEKKELRSEAYDGKLLEITLDSKALISNASPKIESPYIEIKLNKSIQEFAKPKMDKNYTTLMIKNIVALNSSNAIRLYELLSMWKNQKKHKISILDLKREMHLGDKYINLASTFVASVLNPCIKNINEKTDLNVECEHLGRGERREVIFRISISSVGKSVVKAGNKSVVFNNQRKYWNKLDIRRDDLEYKACLYLIKLYDYPPSNWFEEHYEKIDYLDTCLNFMEDQYENPRIQTIAERREILLTVIRNGVRDFCEDAVFGPTGYIKYYTEEEISNARSRAREQMSAIKRNKEKIAKKKAKEGRQE